jgi:hypothetical protein
VVTEKLKSSSARPVQEELQINHRVTPDASTPEQEALDEPRATLKSTGVRISPIAEHVISATSSSEVQFLLPYRLSCSDTSELAYIERPRTDALICSEQPQFQYSSSRIRGADYFQHKEDCNVGRGPGLLAPDYEREQRDQRGLSPAMRSGVHQCDRQQVVRGVVPRQPRKYRKPATYDGSGNLSDFLIHFEIVTEINRWVDAEKALELATCLRGAAQGVLSDLQPDSIRSYRHLVLALNNRFQPDNQTELY